MSIMNIEEIINLEERNECDILVEVAIANIEGKKASELLVALSSELPLQKYGLEHLKRIRKDKEQIQIVLAPIGFDESLISLKTSSLLGERSMTRVSKYLPRNRNEFDAWGKYWPINFRPSELDRCRERGLPLDEVKIVAEWLKVLEDVDKNFFHLHNKDNFGALIVNPSNNKKVITSVEAWQFQIDRLRDQNHSRSIDSIAFSPIHTPVMICVEAVAAILRCEIPSDPELLPEDHYLCTGLDLYLVQEPDMMSSMALIHSRIRRVIYLKKLAHYGCLGSVAHIHDMIELNHKFRVFVVNK